jgi:ubiquinone/menaquinone biosynthesis C-methylase UbiE
LDGVDIVADLNEPLDLIPDNCVEYVFSQHALEHVQHLLPLLREIFRITKHDGFIEIIVPHFSNPYYYSDPTHVRFYGLYSMYYFVDESKQHAIRKVPSFYSDVRFDIESVRIEFYQLSMIDKLVVPFLSRLVNRNIQWQNFYERRLSSLFHAWQLRFHMRPDK